ncbi:hypothetical protein ZWY2020_022484 [Hordeum vulgare]|nr:hypothetical protein ZWY2020_022484 [Hordeum vulgare]
MSLRSLRNVTGCLVEMNQEVVHVVLASKHNVWGCADLLALVEDYFDPSLHTLDFFAALDRAIRHVRDSQLVLHSRSKSRTRRSGMRTCSTRCAGSRPTHS